MKYRSKNLDDKSINKSQHQSMAIQMQQALLPVPPNPENSHPSPSLPLKQPHDPRVKGLLGNLDTSRRQNQSKELQRGSRQRAELRRVKVNVMSLQDKAFVYDRNIYNIAVGDLFTKQCKIDLLKDEITALKQKIQQLQEQEWARNSKITGLGINRTITSDSKELSRSTFGENQPKSTTLRRSFAGRLYKKQRGGVQTERKPTVQEKRLETQTLDVNSVFGHETGSRWHALLPRDPPSTFRYREGQTDQASIRITHKKQQHDIIASNKFETIGASSGRGKTARPPSQKESEKRVNQGKSARRGSMASAGSRKGSISERYQPDQVLQAAQGVKTVQKSVIESQGQDVTVFKQYYPEADIKSIEDDFRAKMLQKLQIPQGFPLQSPDPYLTIEQQESLAVLAYRVFGVKIGTKNKKKLQVSKFRNGVHYQLKPNKNMVRYFNGSVYFGDWQTNSPVQGAKNGFGFEYIPGKYYYLGRFKEGLRDGKGVIRLISKNGDDAGKFVGYDGQWEKGKPHGYGCHIDDKNTKYMGQFKAGEKIGKAVIVTQQGLRYEGEVKKGLKHGKGAQIMVNGDEYEGQFCEGKFQGQGLYKWKNGNQYQGEFKRGKREGKGRWQSSTGGTFEGQFLNDVKEGWGRIRWENGQSYQGFFKNDLRHGQGTYSHPNGKSGKYLWAEGRIDRPLNDTEQKQSQKDQQSEDSIDEPESLICCD